MRFFDLKSTENIKLLVFCVLFKNQAKGKIVRNDGHGFAGEEEWQR